MCRNIRTLHNFEPPVTDDEIRAAAIQYVRKVSGMRKPAATNVLAFDKAIDEVAATTHRLMETLTSAAPAKNREEEKRKARERWQRRAERTTAL